MNSAQILATDLNKLSLAYIFEEKSGKTIRRDRNMATDYLGAFRGESRLLVARSGTRSTVIQFRRTEPITWILDFSRLCVRKYSWESIYMWYWSKIRDWYYRAESTVSKSPSFFLNISRFYIIELEFREIMDIRERFRTSFEKGVL